tara:strand:+ start:368 stop:631 length:264 start_codon:yes stop_codon:yes gene_type:complete
MDYQKILNMLEGIEGQLDDAYYSLPDYNANSDSQGYIDGARCDLYHLKDEIEKSILDSNKEPMGPDGLPLNFPYHINDGEGRLKGNN